MTAYERAMKLLNETETTSFLGYHILPVALLISGQVVTLNGQTVDTYLFKAVMDSYPDSTVLDVGVEVRDPDVFIKARASKRKWSKRISRFLKVSSTFSTRPCCFATPKWSSPTKRDDGRRIRGDEGCGDARGVRGRHGPGAGADGRRSGDADGSRCGRTGSLKGERRSVKRERQSVQGGKTSKFYTPTTTQVIRERD